MPNLSKHPTEDDIDTTDGHPSQSNKKVDSAVHSNTFSQLTWGSNLARWHRSMNTIKIMSLIDDQATYVFNHSVGLVFNHSMGLDTGLFWLYILAILVT